MAILELPPFLIHDDVIKWKHFPRYWPFTQGIQGSSNKRLSKQSWGWWFETHSPPLWRHSNVYIVFFGLSIKKLVDGRYWKCFVPPIIKIWFNPRYWISVYILPVSDSPGSKVHIVAYIRLFVDDIISIVSLWDPDWNSIKTLQILCKLLNYWFITRPSTCYGDVRLGQLVTNKVLSFNSVFVNSDWFASMRPY